MPTGVYERHRRNPGLTEKIKTGQIVARLQSNFAGELDPPLTREQIRCAEILLRKVVPDLSTHHVEGNVTVNFVDFLRSLNAAQPLDRLPSPTVVDVSPEPSEVRH